MGRGLRLRRVLARVLAAVLVPTATLGGLYVTRAGASAAATCASQTPRPGWVETWSTSLIAASRANPTAESGFHNQTLREVIPVTLGGTQVRITLSNAYGHAPLIVHDAHVAISRPGGSIVASTNRQVSFSGRPFTVIPPGAETSSDQVDLDVPNGSELAVSIYLPGRTGPSSWEPGAYMTSYVSTTGDHAGALGADAFTTPIAAWYYLAGVAVHNPAQIGSVVAFGDSITAGQKSTLNGRATWPDFLARRVLASEPVGHRVSILDAGIPGNQVLNSSADGTSAERRFKVDVAAQTGVRTVILLEGTNDLRLDKGANNVVPLTAAELIQGMSDIISQAHADGLRIIGGTILPFAGDTGYYNAHSAAVREQVNHWILTSGAFDGVINFAAAVADPSDPQEINPAYGGPVHPNDAGYQAMANGVSLNLLCP